MLHDIRNDINKDPICPLDRKEGFPAGPNPAKVSVNRRARDTSLVRAASDGGDLLAAKKVRQLADGTVSLSCCESGGNGEGGKIFGFIRKCRYRPIVSRL